MKPTSMSIASHASFRTEFIVLTFLLLGALGQPAKTQELSTPPAIDPASLTVDQVVQNLVQMNLHRVEALRGFQGTRTYRAEYHGFGGARSAEMVVAVEYLSPDRKEFTVQSATGSKLIIDKVFKKLLEAEKEALAEEMKRRSALNTDNYRFTMVGYERDSSGAMYVLKVEPRSKDKFLYSGRIWVDASDFAVVRLEAVPAKNPSFWTKKSEVVQVYKKFGDFWLPLFNRSLSSIRLGGRAELTINYEAYEITAAHQVRSSLASNAGNTGVSGTARTAK